MSEAFEKAVLEKLDSLHNKFDSRVGNLESAVSKLDSRVGGLEFELKDTQEVVQMNSQILIKLETTVATKIDSLFDSYSANEDKHQEYNSHFDELDSQVFNHDIRISALEDNYRIAHA